MVSAVPSSPPQVRRQSTSSPERVSVQSATLGNQSNNERSVNEVLGTRPPRGDASRPVSDVARMTASHYTKVFKEGSILRATCNYCDREFRKAWTGLLAHTQSKSSYTRDQDSSYQAI